MHAHFLEEAIRIAAENAKTGGGPFGAIIVHNDTIIARGVNQVTALNDPTAHAEIQAIRAAAADWQTPHLTNCIIYSSAQPCIQCSGAIYWAHIAEVYYATPQNEVSEYQFDDQKFHDHICGHSPQHIAMNHLDIQNHRTPFEIWRENPNAQPY